MKGYGVYIGGKWIDSVGGQSFETANPATGEILGTFPRGTEEDVIKAIEGAERAWPNWRGYPAPRRGEILLKAASILRKRKDELGELVTREMGKVIAEGRGDVQEAIDFLEYISGEGRRLLGETTTSELPRKFCMTVRQPIGIVGCITPWNFPMAVPCWKLGAALISGNAVVYKPATLTPLCAATLMEVFEEAGVPPGVLNMVTGPADTVGRVIVEHPKIRAVSFTGGIAAGKDVNSRAAAQMKRVGLELGGKNPLIILDDANIDLAIEGVLFGAFGTAGQRCTATGRLIVHEEVYDEVMEKLLSRTRALKIGNPIDPAMDVGPVSSQEQEDKILKYIEIGVEEGAKLIYGGKKLSGGPYDRGFFIEPTIFEAKHGIRITKDEIFGPVLPVIRVRGYDEAVKIANDVEYGLTSAIYTRDINTAYRAIDELEAGITYVNAPTIGAEVHLPFGGVKQTGTGAREAGTTAIEEFTEIKTVFIDYSERLQKAQIED
ncbi:MAG: aldehyde dehydrogenase family protein [Deltaproteobacteria bacterium]|nr:aldehyde dehydrogenase family protein [Deltaproteobacteria bacterium]